MTHKYSVCFSCKVVKDSFTQSKSGSRCKCNKPYLALCKHCYGVATRKNKGNPVHKPHCIILYKRRIGKSHNQGTHHRRVRENQVVDRPRGVQNPHTPRQSVKVSLQNNLQVDIWDQIITVLDACKPDEEILGSIPIFEFIDQQFISPPE